VSTVGGVGEVDRDLGVLDPPGGPGVLTLHTHRARTLLEVSGFIDHQPLQRAQAAADLHEWDAGMS
jgi:hypothetical protein